MRTEKALRNKKLIKIRFVVTEIVSKLHNREVIQASRLRQTANAYLYHVTKFPLYLSFTVHYVYT